MPIGSKKIYLPNFTIALIRTPRLPPNYAQFIVPLNINKLDLRDYLLHAYGVEVLSVRSYIQQQKILKARPSERALIGANYYRPRAIKKMTVELAMPFVYPEEPTDLSPWDNEFYNALQKEQAAEQKYQGLPGEREMPRDRPKVRKMAEELLAKQEAEMETFEVEKELSVR
ncbi:mitochondrial 54S ribosomal protein YmL41 [Rhizina undulata]